MREQTKWAQRCVNNVTPGGRDRNTLSLSNTLEKKQDAADMAAIRAYGRACCYPDLTDSDKWLAEYFAVMRPFMLAAVKSYLPECFQTNAVAEDIVQVTILRAIMHTKAGTIRKEEGDLSAWLLQGLRWDMTSYMIRTNRDEGRNVEYDEDWMQQMGGTPNPESRYVDSVTIHNALAKLTPIQRSVAIAAYIDGYTAQEIADMRNRCIQGVKKIMGKAKAHLTADITR